MRGLARKRNVKIRKQRRPIRNALRKIMPIFVGIVTSVSFLGCSSSKNKAANHNILNSNQDKSVMAGDKTKKAIPVKKTKKIIPVKLTKSERRLRDVLTRLGGAEKEDLDHYRELNIRPWRFKALQKLAESCEKLGLSYNDFFELSMISEDPWRGNRKFLIKQRDKLKMRRALQQLKNILQYTVNQYNSDYLKSLGKTGQVYLVVLDPIRLIKNEIHVKVSFVASSRKIPKKLAR